MEASVAIQVLPQRVGGNDEVCRIVDEAIAYIQTKFPMPTWGRSRRPSRASTMPAWRSWRV